MKFWTIALLLLMGLGISACGSETTDEEANGTDSTLTEVDLGTENPAQEPTADVDDPAADQAAAPEDYEAVAKAFIQAKARLNFEEAKKHVTGQAATTLVQVEEEMKKLPAVLKKKFKEATVSEVECEEKGDTRICRACCNSKGQSFDPVRLGLKNGTWRVVAF